MGLNLPLKFVTENNRPYLSDSIGRYLNCNGVTVDEINHIVQACNSYYDNQKRIQELESALDKVLEIADFYVPFGEGYEETKKTLEECGKLLGGEST